MSRAFQQSSDESSMQRVTGAIRRQPAEHLLADQREIAEEVENLMTDKLIRIAQRGLVQHAVFGEHDRVLQRAASDQTGLLKRLHLMVETKSPSRSDLACGSFPE